MHAYVAILHVSWRGRAVLIPCSRTPRMAFLQEGQANLREPRVCIRDGSLDRSLWLRLRLMLRRRLTASAVAAAEMQLRLSADAVAAASAAASAHEASLA